LNRCSTSSCWDEVPAWLGCASYAPYCDSYCENLLYKSSYRDLGTHPACRGPRGALPYISLTLVLRG
jgi:hypothetical protein